MVTIKGWILVGVAIATAAVSCAAPQQPEAGQRAAGADANRTEGQRAPGAKRITAAIRGEPTSLNYTLARAGGGGAPGTSEVDLLVNAGLVIEDRQKQLRPQLAEAVPSIENGLWRLFPDGRMETTWKIRQDARWHDSTPFSADDLVFTLKVGMDDELGLVGYPAYEFIDTIHAADPRTLVAAWKRPFIQADSLFSIAVGWPIPKQVLEPTYLEDKARLMGLPYWTSAYVGAGPYRLREWIAGSHALLEAFDGYALGRPRIDGIDVKFIPDPSTLLANVLAGEVDVSLGRGIFLEQALQAAQQWRDGKLDTSLQSWLALYPQFLNPSPPVVADVQFRRGLMHATDRQAIVDTFMGGLTSVANTVVSPSDREYREIEAQAINYPYEPRRATQLMESLGYAKSSDGMYRDGAGQRLTVEIRTQAGDELQEKLILTIADYWQRAGVGAEPFIFPRQRRDDLEFRQTRPAFEMVRQPSEIIRFHGAGTPLPENSFRGHNRTRYRNAELDASIDRYFVTIPWSGRMQVLGQIVGHLSDQLVAMGMIYDAQPMLVANRLVNVSAAAQSANAHEWDLR